MSEFAERLWPEECDEPKIEVVIGDATFTLTRENTHVQQYRTGVEEFDDQLQQYDHFIHRYVDKNGEQKLLWCTFSTMEPEHVDFLIDNYYPKSISHKLDDYIIEYIAATESQSIEDLEEITGPDFGREQT